MDKTKTKVKGIESKANKFNRIAKIRVQKVLKSLRILGNCSNRSTYEYNLKQVEKMSLTLTKALEQTLAKFHKSKKEQESFDF